MSSLEAVVEAGEQVKKRIRAEEETIPKAEFFDSLGVLFENEKEALYQFFLYVRKRTRGAGLRRFCGTSAEIHPYRSIIIGLAYGTIRKTMATDLVIIAGHELLEDCGVKLKGVREELEKIVSLTNSGINVGNAVKGIQLLTREKTGDYQTDLDCIADQAIADYKADDRFYGSSIFGKGCEAFDNVDTADQLMTPDDSERSTPIDIHLGALEKGLLVAGTIQRVIHETEDEPSLALLKQDLVYSIIGEIDYATGEIERRAKVFEKRQRQKRKLGDYQGEINEYRRRNLGPYGVLREKASSMLTHPKEDSRSVSARQIPLPQFSHPLTSTSLVA